MKKKSLVLCISLALGGIGLAAQGFSGSVEAQAGWNWKDAQLLPFTQIVAGAVDGKVGDPDQPSAQYSAKLTLSYDPADASTSVDLGETWVKLFAGPFDLSAGNQVVSWSNTDAFWPIDVVNPMDLSLPIDPAKLPVPMARIVYNGDFITVDLVAQPYWIASILPAKDWQPANPLSALPVKNNVPAFTWNNAAYGGHVKASLGLLQGLDLGATFYRGRLPTPRASVDLDGTYTPIGMTLDYDRFTMFGADLVLSAVGGLLVKSEWAYTTLRDSNIVKPEADAATLQGVSGFEYRLGGVQLIGEYVLDWAKDPEGKGDTLAHGAVGIASTDIGSRLNLKVAVVHEFKGDSGMVTPQFSYTLADALKLECAAYLFYGDGDTKYGDWKDNSLGRVSLKQSF
jgi:hypothetical protein